jgi:hypothetical protein
MLLLARFPLGTVTTLLSKCLTVVYNISILRGQQIVSYFYITYLAVNGYI